MKSIISLIKYTKSPESLRIAVEWCNGFSGLHRDNKVLIKPNLVQWDDQFKIAPFGVYTTTRLVEDLVMLLRDFGCKNIAIGEGSVEVKKGIGTMDAFAGLGYNEISKRYGVSLIDFNKSQSVHINVQDGLIFSIAKEAVEFEFLINFPVLKTHPQSKVSLGLKNLKGCLKTSSKKLCHHPKLGLEYCFQFIADIVKPSLTIIDGIYALEKGAFQFGNAYRKDIIVASKDILAADMVGAKTIGYEPQDIFHFIEYAKRHHQSLSLSDYDIMGEKIEDHISPLKWDWSWNKDNTGPAIFDRLGLKGVAVPKYDDSICSGCVPIVNVINILVLSAFKGEPLPNIEILYGKLMQARPGYDKTVLLGDCITKANENNSNMKEAIIIKGCPPKYEDFIAALKDVGLEIREESYFEYLDQQGKKYDGKEGYSWNFFKAG